MRIFTAEELNEEESRLFLTTYRNLASHTRSLFNSREWHLVRRLVRRGVEAGVYARDQHGVHPLLMSLLTAWTVFDKVGLRQPSLLTIMLYPLMDGGILTAEEIEHEFGESGQDTAHLMSCMARVKGLYQQHDYIQDENFRKLLLSFAEDIRVVICLIADRYALMKLLNHNPDVDYRKHVTEECRFLYTPMAHRLGLYAIKSELEDMAVKYDHRDVYDRIADELQQTKKVREAYIKAFIDPLEARLTESTGIVFHIKGRTKSISSIWNKIKAQNTTLDKIYDLFAIRIIIDAEATAIRRGLASPDDEELLAKKAQSIEKALCWQVYSIVTDMYVPNPKRLKDWLSIPKSNGYESLHITVYGPEQRWVEVQIRTRRMDEIAERGLAAHWRYKGIKSEGAADHVMASIREILEHNSSPDELMKDFSMGLYDEEVFVFTPNGDVHKLAKGATVLDFAFHIHSRLGLTCVGARVSGKNVKINYQLHSGDTVEIITSPQQTPKRDWLSIVATSKARIRIKQGLKELENREAETGRELLQRRFKNRKIDIDESAMSRVIIRMGFKTQTAFFHALSLDEINVDDVIHTYEEMTSHNSAEETETHSADTFDLNQALNGRIPDASSPRSLRDDVLVIDKDLKGLDYRLAGCCHPIYGDDVVGFVSISGGIRIHRADCPNIRDMQERYPYRIVRARWSGKSGSQYSITLRVVGNDDIGIVSNISSIINKEKDTLLRAINIDSGGGLFQGHLTVMVNDLTSLTSLIKKIKTIKGVKQVDRVN